MAELEGKIALITGSSRGLGATMALVMAKHGCDVIVNCLETVVEGGEVTEGIRALGRRALLIQADVTDRSQVCQMVETVLSEWGRLDILVNNAGRLFYHDIETLEPNDWYRGLDANLTSQVYCAQAALPRMVQQKWGRIVNMSSISAQRGSPSGDLTYSASKAGAVALTKTLARRYGPHGITVNAVAPGQIDAGMIRAWSPERRVQVLSDIPLGRLGRAEEVAEVVAFLASDRASYITGQLIAINGGQYM